MTANDNPLNALTGGPTPTAGSAAPERFPADSRYASTPVEIIVDDRGVERRYLTRRFISDSDPSATIAEHQVVAGDRLDLLAHRYYGDPLLNWRIADTNHALDPGDLTDSPGDVLEISRPDATGAFGGAS